MALGSDLNAGGALPLGAAVSAGGRLPSRDTLEYVQALATVALLLIALGLFLYYLATAPRKALSMALARVGMKP